MTKLLNPYRNLPGYHCFACSPDHPFGLKLEFWEEGDSVYSVWDPGRHFDGYPGIVHGGIQCTLMDEVASWFVQLKLKTAGVTYSMHLKFHQPLLSLAGPVTCRARLKSTRLRLATISADITDVRNKRCTSSEVVYYLYPEKEARERFSYPGYEQFLPEGMATDS
ncbi:MAG: PaaI family thioesterase [Bacteroidales bacterium]|nr:PaaI family thioesterase [Bacteroidales bacterium]